jgi:hypothetical protein
MVDLHIAQCEDEVLRIFHTMCKFPQMWPAADWLGV